MASELIRKIKKAIDEPSLILPYVKKELSKRKKISIRSSNKQVGNKQVGNKQVGNKQVGNNNINKPVVNKKSLMFSRTDVNIFSNFLVLHTGENKVAHFHISLWYDFFCHAGVNLIVITRFIDAYNDIKSAYPQAVVVYAKGKNDIDELFNNFYSIKACFYPSNTGNNAHLLYQLNCKHIFIGHGDSDKSASAHKYFRVYDENWVAGQAHIDRFKNAEFNENGLRQVKVGRPTLLPILKKARNNWKDRFDGELNLLYLPTWEGTFQEQDYSSLSLILDVLQKIILFDDVNVSIKLHPNTGNRLQSFANLNREIERISIKDMPYDNNIELGTVDLEYENSSKINLIDKRELLSSYIKQSNIFICDISAVVSECLAANAPIFLYVPKDKDIKIAKSNVEYSEYCYQFSTVDELLEILRTVLDGNDYLAESRKQAMEYIINVEDTLDNKFITEIQNLA